MPPSAFVRDPRRPRRSAAAALLLLLAAACSRQEAARRPNVLLISIDTLRADHVSCYGYERKTTPRIDALAAEGVLFETAVSSSSWTLPAHAALFTSLPDSVHGAFRPQDRLVEERVTLAERLSAAGYRTVGLYSGPFLHPAFGLSQGFDEWISCTASDREPPEAADDGEEAARIRKSRERNDRAAVAHEDVTSPKLLAGVQRWLAARTDEAPFFLFVHMWDPHYNYIPPPPYDRMWDPDYEGTQDGRGLWSLETIRKPLPARDLEHVIALYDGEISFTDEYVGRIVDELGARGLLEDTLVIVTADHGEEFFEHGCFGHRRTLMDECVLVPLVLRWPKRLPAGLRVAAQVRLHDVAPTVLSLTGGEPFATAFGSSLVELLAAPSGAHRPAFSELHIDRQESLRHPPLKALHVESDGRSAVHVFDLGADPGERRPLADSDPRHGAAAGELAEVSRHVAGLRALLPVEGAEAQDVPPEVLDELRDLGYIGD